MARSNSRSVKTPRGRVFPECYLKWAEDFEKQGFDYDYAFEVIKEKSTFGNSLDYLRKHPKRGGLFGKFKAKKGALSFPRLGDPDLTIVSPPTPSASVLPSATHYSGADEKTARKQSFESVNSLKPEPSAPISMTSPKSYAAAAAGSSAAVNTIKKAGAIVVVRDEHKYERDHPIEVPKVHLVVEESPSQHTNPSIIPSPQRPLPQVHMNIGKPPSGSPVSAVPVSNSEPISSQSHLNVPGAVRKSPEPLVVSVEQDNDVEHKEPTSAKKSYAQVLKSEVGDQQRLLSSPFKKIEPVDEKALEAAKSPPNSSTVPSSPVQSQYKVNEKVELRRKNGQWVEASVVKDEGKVVVVEYLDGGLKYQKKMPKKSQHLAVFGTNLKPTIRIDEKVFKQEDDDRFKVVKSSKYSPTLKLNTNVGNSTFNTPMSSQLTESVIDVPGTKSRKAVEVVESDTEEDLNRSIPAKELGTRLTLSSRAHARRKSADFVYAGSEYGEPLQNQKNLLPSTFPTPDYESGDLVQIKCSDGHWYRGKVLDVGAKVVLVEYRRSKQKFQKKLPIRSKLLRMADDDDVASVRSNHSASERAKRKVSLSNCLENMEAGKKILAATAASAPKREPPKVPKSATSTQANKYKTESQFESKKYMTETVFDSRNFKTESAFEANLASSRTVNDSLSDSNSGENLGQQLVEILRSDGIWYEGRVIKFGKKACVVEYAIDAKKYQKVMPLDSKSLAPFGTHILPAEVGDDIEYLTARGEWVKAQVCEIRNASYVILYMEGSDLVEKKIFRCSENIARYGEHSHRNSRLDNLSVRV